MKNPVFLRFHGVSSMRKPRASIATGLARASMPVLWLATLSAPLLVFALATWAPGAGLLRDAVAALFLVGIALIGTSGSRAHAIVASVASFLLYRIHVVRTGSAPTWSANDLVVLGAFVGCAALVAWIAAGPRRQVRSLTVSQAHAALRRELAERLADQQDESAVARTAVAFLERVFDAPAAIWHGSRVLHGSDAAPSPRLPQKLDAPSTVDGWMLVPMQAVDDQPAVIALQRRRQAAQGDDVLLHLLATDIVHSLVRAHLTHELQQERVANESERLCTALLASVSHDIRTPLTTIIGAAEGLRQFGAGLSDADREGLLSTIEAEGQRLDRYVQNLVDIARIGDGPAARDVAPTPVDELVASAVARLRRYEPDVTIRVSIEPGTPPLRVHAPLVEQAIFNVLHNAAKFSPGGVPLSLRAARIDDDTVAIDVLDAGPGIPRAERELVFDMFYSADRGDPSRAGTGLGLAISQSIVRAHGGEVSAHAGAGGVGTRMRLTVPAVAEHAPCH